MKNDALLKSFTQKGVKTVSSEKNMLQTLKLSPLDSGQLFHVKGGETGDDDIVFGN